MDSTGFDLAGREYPGQVVKNIGGSDYILIGNKQQLQAIGTGIAVTEPIWQVAQTRTLNITDGPAGLVITIPVGASWDTTGEGLSIIYPGDADIAAGGKLYGEPSSGYKELGDTEVTKEIKDWASVGYAVERNIYWSSQSDGAGGITFAENQTRNLNISGGNAKYTNDANYIIFRDIDLAGELWEPLYFRGNMVGAKASTLTNALASTDLAGIRNILGEDTAALPVISNVNIVKQNNIQQREGTTDVGVGFLNTLSTPLGADLNALGQPIYIGNITLRHVSVENQAVSVEQEPTLINFLTGILSGLTSLLLDPLLTLLGIGSIGDLLDNLLTASANDETLFATGSFVGKVMGDVTIENCHVDQLSQVVNQKSYTGGFAGDVEGLTRYEPLTGTLGTLVDILANLLNRIPFLGLGDLVKILLNGGVLNLGALIPISYENAVITGCSVNYSGNGTGVATVSGGEKYVGSFVGHAKGSYFNDNRVTVNDGVDLQITGAQYVGGFNGKISNAVVQGALTSLGIDLFNFVTVSTVTNCHMLANGTGSISVHASSEDTQPKNAYVGGFSGGIFNSYLVECSIRGLKEIDGSNRNYVGGFAGIGSVVDVADLGGQDAKKDLLGYLGTILKGLTTGNGILDTSRNEATNLLSLVGIKPSVLAGCTVAGISSGYGITGGDYVGGFVGGGEAIQIGSTDELKDVSKDTTVDYEKARTKGRNKGVQYELPAIVATNTVENLGTVTGENYVGGAMGQAKMTSAASVLGGAVKAAEYMRLELKDLQIQSVAGSEGYKVVATGQYAGGVLGQGIGCEIRNTNADGLQDVRASNYVGGYAGSFGTGNLADVGGLNLLGLISVNSLLDIGAMVETLARDSSISGVPTGFTVEATLRAEDTDETTEMYAGGYVGETVSASFNKCNVRYLKQVTSDMKQGMSGGFIGKGRAGALLADTDQADAIQAVQLNQLLGVASYLLVSVKECNVEFVNPPIRAFRNTASNLGMMGEVDTNTGASNITNEVGRVCCTEVAEVNGENSMLENQQDTVGEDTKSRQEGMELRDSLPLLSNLLNFTVSPTMPQRLMFMKQLEQAAPLIQDSANQRLVTTLFNGILKNNRVIDRGIIKGNYAGGFVGYGEALQVNEGLTVGGDPAIGNTVYTSIKNLQLVEGEAYAGGFAGRLEAGNLAQTGKIGLLGIVNVADLLKVLDVGYSRISSTNVNGHLLQVKAVGKKNDQDQWLADVGDGGGFIGKGTAVAVQDSLVQGIELVYGKYHAGGFVGAMKSGSAVTTELKSELLNQLIGNLGDLLKVLSVAGWTVEDSKVVGTTAGLAVIADDLNEASSLGMAGGFVGEMESGTVNNTGFSQVDRKGIAVERLRGVEATRYAGGFGGKVYPGATVGTGSVNVLSVVAELTNLLSALQVFVPTITHAGVQSIDDGFTVRARAIDFNGDSKANSAGGFIGYGSGVQVSNSDVNQLAHTTVVEPDDLQAVDSPSYFDEGESSYAVWSTRSAGGYIGEMDVGNGASVGGVNILSKLIDLSGAASVLSIVVSTIEFSDVYGAPGGYAVFARGDKGNQAQPDRVGHAGGYAGKIKGGHIQNSHANHIAYIIGSETAGGYVGEFIPGDLATVAENIDILNGLVTVGNGLLSVLNTFVPSIHNSYATGIPCGCVIRAQDASDTRNQRGKAGGYVGCNIGGQIWGNDASDWKGQTYVGEQVGSDMIRLRSVYGYEYAGGYSGRMEVGALAQTGGIELLGGLVSLSNVLDVLGSIYPTHKETQVNGPLRNLDLDTWNNWVDFVGKRGPYQDELQQAATEEQLQEFIQKYAYGYDVSTGKSEVTSAGGYAGGYVGSMTGGVVSQSLAQDVKSTRSLKAAGGFAGEMRTGGLADVGGISLFNQDILNVSDLLGVAKVFVPAIEESSVVGYQSGAKIEATGQSEGNYDAGYAGGYVGIMEGGQIKGTTTRHCDILNLRSVKGKHAAIGGYAGRIAPAALVEVGSAELGNTSGGILSQVLGTVLQTPAKLANVLEATVSTIEQANVSAVDTWGFTVDGMFEQNGNPAYTVASGGFAGIITGAVLGDQAQADGLNVENLRYVKGGQYAGGFFGFSDMSSTASVGTEINGEKIQVLEKLAEIGNISALDLVRTNISEANVRGIEKGFTVEAVTSAIAGVMDSTTHSGNAGGFGGTLQNGTVLQSEVTNLRSITGVNMTGGFIGHTGKSGLIDANEVSVLNKLLNAGLGVADMVGASVIDSSVTGVADGFTVQNQGPGSRVISGGFVGYGDLGQISQSHVRNLATVRSDGVAGGFIGQSSMAYVVDADVNSALLEPILTVVNGLVRLLYLDELQNLNLVDLNLGILRVEAFNEGKTLGVTLLGLPIRVSLSKENGIGQDVAIVSIGDSTIRLPANGSDGLSGTQADLEPEIKVTLIKGNRTRVADSSVSGIPIGYDVFAGGATHAADAISDKGAAGGFVGFNQEGLFANNEMFYADTIKGSAGQVNPFSGTSQVDTNYQGGLNVEGIESENNHYRVYRMLATDANIQTVGNGIIPLDGEDAQGFKQYVLKHYAPIFALDQLKDAEFAGDNPIPLNVYISDAEADLMAGTRTNPTAGVDLTISKIITRENGEAAPIGNQEFLITVRGEGNGYRQVVALTEGTKITLNHLPAGTYTIQESLPTGYTLQGYRFGNEAIQPVNGNTFMVTIGTEDMQVTLVNQKDGVGFVEENAGGHFDLINHVPVVEENDDPEPEPVRDPCEGVT